MSTPTITPADLERLAKELDTLFDGDLSQAAKRMDQILYMLFFVNPDVISREEVEITAYQLRHLRDAFVASINSLK